MTQRLETFIKWYADNDMANQKIENLPNIHKRQPLKILGKSKKGFAIIRLMLKNLSLKGNPNDDIIKYVFSFVEHAVLNYSDPKVDKYIMILDIKDYTSDNFDKEGLKKLVPVFSNGFPDAMSRMFILNVGFIASGLYSMISVWLHEITRKKIVVVKEDNEKILEALKEELDLKLIPKIYGGAKEDSQDECQARLQ